MCNMIFNEGIFYKTTSLTLDLASSFVFTCALHSSVLFWAGFCADRRGFSPLTSTFCFCYCVWLEQFKKFLGSQSLISAPGQDEVLTAVPSLALNLISQGRQHKSEKRRDHKAACTVYVTHSPLQMEAVKYLKRRIWKWSRGPQGPHLV